MKDDLTGRVVHQISEDIGYSSSFLNLALETLRDRGDLTVSSVIELLAPCPLFTRERIPLIERGLQAYFDGDHVVAAHVLIPQIEAAVRELLIAAGGPAFQPRVGDLRFKTLDTMLRNSVVEKVLSDRVCTYLRVLLTDTRGWNLRNNVMHGYLDDSHFSPTLSNRLLHVVVLISPIREEGPSPEGE